MKNLYIYVGIAFIAAILSLFIMFNITQYPVSSSEASNEIRYGSTVLAYVIRNPNYSISTADVRSTAGNISLPIRGKASIMTFQYVRCPDICHWETYVFVYLMNKTLSAGLGRDVVFITIDVDPWRSTYQDVTEYQSKRAGKLLSNITWIWVLDDPDRMAKIWENFRIFVARDPNTGLITHSAGFYIFDKEGRLIYIIQPTSEGWKNLEELSKGVWDILYKVAKQ
ncbi:MAG: SCO family protein [Desulfurococcales archaeon]|nr:SCO family protein [Desulfurococcales archaeon]